MRDIQSKKESDRIIEKLAVNKMLEGIFTTETLDQLPIFLNEHQYPFYNIRDKSESAGKFLYKKTASEILTEAPKYSKFSVYESLAEADEKLILQGDIQIDSKFNLLASLSDIKLISNRKAMHNPVYNLKLDLKQKREPYINGLTYVIDYIVEHGLLDCIVEFSLFDIKVGVNNENIIIWEMRNY